MGEDTDDEKEENGGHQLAAETAIYFFSSMSSFFSFNPLHVDFSAIMSAVDGGGGSNDVDEDVV